MKLPPFLLIGLWVSSCLVSGCKDPNPPVAEKPKESIIGKTTTEIGEFDPTQDKVADLSTENSSPLHAVTAGAYKFGAGRSAQLGVMQALNLFNAEHDRYPKDHEEFMERIIKANSMQLPVLPGGLRYKYDVENHELKIVEAK